MAYSAELILSGETFTANIIKGSPGDTGPSGIDGVDGVATVPVYDDGTQLTEKISVLKFTGGGKTVTASGNEITVDIPTATNDYTQLINVPTTVEFSTIINVPSTLSGNYIDLAGKPFIPTDLSELADSQGLLSSFIFDGSFTSLTGKPTTTAGYGITDAFDYEYNSLLNKPTLFDFQFASLLNVPLNLSGSYDDLDNLPDLTALNYVTPSVLAGYGYVTTSVLTSTLTGYVQNSTLSNYVTNEVLTSTLNSSLAAYVQTGMLTNYVTNTTLAGYNYATQSYVNSAVAQLIDSSPATLNTLNELAAALGDDPNFATTIATQLGAKANSSALANIATSGSWFDLSDKPSTSQIPESVNLYYTDARVQTKLGNVSGDIIPTTDITYDLGSPTKRFKDLYLSGNSIFLGNGLVLRNIGGRFSVTDLANDAAPVSLDSNTTSDLAEGTNLYYTTARANADFDTHITTKSTNNIAEGANLYYTEARVNSNFATKDTADLTEGTNLYYTDARVDAEIDLYVTGGTGVTVSSGVIAIGQPVATSDNVRFNDVRSNGNVIIDGNLTVSGTTITLDATNLAIEDSMIYLNNGSTVANPDLGIAGNYNDGTYAHAGMFRDATDGTWKFYQGYTPEPDASAFIDTTHISFAYAPIKASLFTGNLVGNVTGNVTGNLLGNVTGTVSSLSNQTTSSLNEGSNLYYTDSRVGVYLANNQYVTQTAVSNSIAAASSNYATSAQGAKADSALQTVSFAQLTSKPTTTSAYGITNLADVATSGLYSQLIGKPNLAAVATSGIFSSLLSRPTTLSGYGITDAATSSQGGRADTAVQPAEIGTAAAQNVSYFATAGQGALADSAIQSLSGYATESYVVNAVATKDNTDEITEGFSNLYFTNARADARVNAVSANYATAAQGVKADSAIQSLAGYATESFVGTAVSNLVASAPALLNTLDELAAALGDDANFSTTVTNSIGTKLATADFTSTANTWLGTKTTTNLVEGTNLYYTDGRATTGARAAVSATGDLSYNSSTGEFGVTTYKTSNFETDLGNKSTSNLVEGTNLYYTTARLNADFDTRLIAKSTSNLSEGTNLYYTNARVRAAVSASGDLTYNSTTGQFSVTTYKTSNFNTDFNSKTADALPEGTTNLYYTTARINNYLTANNYALTSDISSAITSASGDYATASQGALAASALQSVTFADLVSTPNTIAGYGIVDAISTANTINALALSTSANLASIISDETGTGALVFGTSPTIVTPTVTGGTFNGGTFISPILAAPSVSLINGGTNGGSTLTLRSTSDTTKATAGILIDETIVSTSTATGALVVSGGLGVGGTLSVTEIYAERFTEKLNTNSASLSGIVAFSYLNGTSYYHTGFLGDFTANFTNVPVTDNRTIVFIIMVEQDANPRIPTAVQIEGVNSPINWLNNSAPTGTESNIDQFIFTLIRTSSSWKVLGTVVTHGAAA